MPHALPARLTARIDEWSETWGLPRLPAQVTVEISTRLRTTLGRCKPQVGEIRIAAFLLEAPPPLLEEVLCHELAHAAACRLHGPAIRAHGAEWRTLMRAAGYVPRPRLATRDLEALPAAAHRARVTWEHRCPVCQAMRNAGRPVYEWRCAACRQAGLPGDLVITRHPPRGGRA